MAKKNMTTITIPKDLLKSLTDMIIEELRLCHEMAKSFEARENTFGKGDYINERGQKLQEIFDYLN